MFPKFIIETSPEFGDYIVIGKCTYHKELSRDIANIKGGGWWIIDKEESTFTLYGSSEDFGKARFGDILACVKNKRVFSSYVCLKNFTDNYKFKYKSESGIVVKL